MPEKKTTFDRLMDDYDLVARESKKPKIDNVEIVNLALIRRICEELDTMKGIIEKLTGEPVDKPMKKVTFRDRTEESKALLEAQKHLKRNECG